MKIFITTGTSAFNSLIISADQNFPHNWSCIAQIGPGSYIPRFRSFQYTDEIYNFYREADVVVTHAGAGSVYSLLELGVHTVVVPNTDRLDKHQSEIAHYVEENKYASVCWSLSGLKDKIINCRECNMRPYKKDSFFKSEEIKSYISL